ncbi:MAG: prephenate dehydrogenase/arogenate dehydrogenase family protein, partial [Desulfovibrionaceae bacterium]|nr:prephenate dehydrogenase/arogenate dehydrogenase family protein [Desulfovibrionaceae bacterium]
MSTPSAQLPAKTLIVGSQGRMGAMLLKRGRRAGLNMVGLDRPLEPERIVSACDGCDLILLCVPAAVLGDVLALVCPHLPSDAVLADITSVKEEPMRQMARTWQGPVVGTHPLFGPRPERGADLPGAILAGARAETEHLALVQGFFEHLGCRVFAC